MNDPIIVTKDLVRRGWSDFEPKLVSSMLSGSLAAGLLALAAAYGISTPEPVPTMLPLIIAGLAGYITPSVGVTVAKKIDGNGYQAESHSGNPVTTVTGSLPVQVPRRDGRAASPSYQQSAPVNTPWVAPDSVQPSFTEVVAPPQPTAGAPAAPEAATTAYPNTSPDEQPTTVLPEPQTGSTPPFWMRDR